VAEPAANGITSRMVSFAEAGEVRARPATRARTGASIFLMGTSYGAGRRVRRRWLAATVAVAKDAAGEGATGAGWLFSERHASKR